MIFDTASRLRRTPGFGWAFSIVSFLVALGLRFAVEPYLPAGFPFLTFFPAVMLTTFLGGRGPGILSAVLSTLAAWYWFIAPYSSFELGSPAMVALGFFIFVMAVDIAIIHTMNEALAAAGTERREALRLADERRTLFQELQHRVANNLSFVSSLLSLHARRYRDRPEIKTDFDDVRLRLETLSNVHRRLYDPDAQSKSIRTQLQGLCDDLIQGSGRGEIACKVEADDLALPLDRLMTLSLVTIEIVSNSLKHAFEGRDQGRIDVSLRQGDDGMVTLRVVDDGVGLPDDFDPTKSNRLGQKIIAGFVRTLGGTLSTETDGGAVTTLVFPSA